MRIQRILVGAALLMLCAAAAYAQVTISSTPVTQVIASGKAEIAGTVRVTAQAATVADTFTIRYGGLPIANQAETGIYAVVIVNGGWDADPSIVSIQNGIITLNVPATSAALDYFEVKNVRLDVSGLAGPASVYATLGTLYTPIVAGQTTAIVINNIGAGMSAAADGETALILANGRDIEDDAYWDITEGFSGAWKSDPQATYDLSTSTTNSATNGTDITVTLSGLPAGVYVDMWTNYTGYEGYFSNTTTQLVVTFSDMNMAEVETLEVQFEVGIDGATLPLAATTYRAYATLSPNTGTKYPKFAQINLPTAGFPVFTVVPNTTNFILPYLTTYTAPGTVYNTGLAIANTTKDPYGVDGALPQDGTVQVYIYGNDGTSITYNSATDAVVGSGLTSAGVLKSGYTWSVLATEILAAKGRTTPITGYAIIVLNATNGHGIAYVADWNKFTAGAPLLVIDPPVTSWSGRAGSGRAERTEN